MKTETKKIALIFSLLTAGLCSIFAQAQAGAEPPDAGETESGATDSAAANSAADGQLAALLQSDFTVFVISSIDFKVKGHTRVDALMYNGEFEEGERLTGRANLEKYVQKKTQLLINQRVLKENVVIDYTIGGQNEDGSFPVSLLVSVEDTWNIIALPKPQWDDNKGFDLTIKARDYNFLGTMNALRFDLGYKYDEKGQSTFKFEIDSDTPFKAWGFNWNVNFDHFFNYRPDAGEPFYYKNVTGLSMELPFKTTTFTFGFEESVIVNDENSDAYKDYPKWSEFQRGPYMASYLYTSWKIPTGLDIYDYGELTYTPRISVSIPHEFSAWPLAEFRRGTSLSFSHSFSFGRTDWIHNFREGISASLSNSYGSNFRLLDNGQYPFSISLTAAGTGFFIIADFFAISSRLQYHHSFYVIRDSHDRNYYDAGDVLRGVKDNSIHADYMLSLNLDFPFRVLEFLPSQWFNNSKLRLFDFELQLSPFLDMGLRHDPSRDITFNPKNILVSGGGEIIVFPASWRSFYVRGSFGVNLVTFLKDPSQFPSGDNRELFIGIGHFF